MSIILIALSISCVQCELSPSFHFSLIIHPALRMSLLAVGFRFHLIRALYHITRMSVRFVVAVHLSNARCWLLENSQRLE